MKFNNPILRGFNPDPCLCRYKDIFYIATSTFEWFPGVQIFQSSDLRKWELITRPITKSGLLDHTPESGGIWAPDLSYNERDGKFYLAYTIVNQAEKASQSAQGFKDTHNFLITADSILGPWTEPVYLNSSGFDPSIFHDDDGKSYVVNMLWNYRAGENNFDGVIIQQLNNKTKKPEGQITKISEGTYIGTTEGPRLYKRKGWYYLVLAEGGTSYLHSVTIGRSRSLLGPYETSKHTAPFLSQVKDRLAVKASISNNPLGFCYDGMQKTGHASFCPINENVWLMAFLSSRPEKYTARCPLGRETSLTTIYWGDDDWPHLDEDIKYNLQSQKNSCSIWKEDFNNPEIKADLQFLRRNFLDDKAFSKHSFIAIRGGESPASRNQKIIGKRITEMRWEAETLVDFEPSCYQEMAGLIVRYNESNQYYLAISKNHDDKKTVSLHCFIQRQYSMPEEFQCKEGPIQLKAECEGRLITFSFKGKDEKNWHIFTTRLDFTCLSDDFYKPIGFTGSFICLTCNDLRSQSKYAFFDYLTLTTFNDEKEV